MDTPSAAHQRTRAWRASITSSVSVPGSRSGACQAATFMSIITTLVAGQRARPGLTFRAAPQPRKKGDSFMPLRLRSGLSFLLLAAACFSGLAHLVAQGPAVREGLTPDQINAWVHDNRLRITDLRPN